MVEPTNILPITPISELQHRPFPKTAACLVIGDEILNGKTADTNSGFFAKFCFNLGIDLKRIEVIPDEEEVIIESVRRLSNNFDFVVTSGGVGSTHDDITYSSIARAFNLPLNYHQPTMNRMAEAIRNTPRMKVFRNETKEAVEARKRMALFPQSSLVVFPNEKLWVPIVIVNDNIHILPGVPGLFRGLLSGYSKYLSGGKKYVRRFIKTYQPESFIAPVLTDFQEKLKDIGIKIGSYPKLTRNKAWVVVSLLARETNSQVVEKIEQTAKEIAEKISGFIIEDSESEIIEFEKTNNNSKL
ncbi:MoaB/Mog domain-containing protein [Gigaspora rosea]|uniref:MoaB/Mog domain-containing protein n=1 Tax=Gigaspora rosea TaxID=44941 RepID=A0A397UGK9_9GLOM|nr:MoaB/Mog domain-containing protein [Gigaspora rosea]